MRLLAPTAQQPQSHHQHSQAQLSNWPCFWPSSSNPTFHLWTEYVHISSHRNLAFSVCLESLRVFIMDIPSAFCLVALIPGAFYLFVFWTSFWPRDGGHLFNGNQIIVSSLGWSVFGFYLPLIFLVSWWCLDLSGHDSLSSNSRGCGKKVNIMPRGISVTIKFENSPHSFSFQVFPIYVISLLLYFFPLSRPIHLFKLNKQFLILRCPASPRSRERKYSRGGEAPAWTLTLWLHGCVDCTLQFGQLTR